MKTFLNLAIIIVCVVDIILLLLEDRNPVFFSKRALIRRISSKIALAILWIILGICYLKSGPLFWAYIAFLMAILDIAIIIFIIWQRKKHKKDWKNLKK